MIDKQLLEILVCPESRASLALADEPLLAKVNRAIAAGQVTTTGGRPLSQPLRGGLVREDREVLYPIVDDIPMLLVDEGIPLDGIA